MALSKDEQAQLDALTKKSQEPDVDESYEVEYWEEDPDGSRRGGRMPYSQGKKLFGKRWPDLFGEKPPAEEEPGAPEADKPAKVERFGRRVG